MLQTPIHVNPSNGQVIHLDKTKSSGGSYINKPEFGYTFQGDRLSYSVCEMYDKSVWDYNTNYYKRMPDSVDQGFADDNYVITDVFNGTYHRNTPVVFAHTGQSSLCIEGHDYMYRYKLYQCYPQSMSDLKDQPLVDIYYSRGKVATAPESGEVATPNHIYIEKGLTNIERPWIVDNKVRGGIWIEINNQRALIDRYVPEKGELYLASNITFPSGNYSNLVGKAYKLFTNYIVTPWYDFKYRAEPTLAFEVNDMDEGISCDANYDQSNAVGIKWYKFDIYKVTGSFERYPSSSTGWTAIPKGSIRLYNEQFYKSKVDINTYETFNTNKWERISILDTNIGVELIESGEKSFGFPDKDDWSWNPHANQFHVSPFDGQHLYRYIACTQEDDVAWREKFVDGRGYVITPSAINQVWVNDVLRQGASVVTYENKAKLVWSVIDDYADCSFHVYRTQYEGHNRYPEPVYIGKATKYSDGTYRITDYTIRNNETCRYEAVAVRDVQDGDITRKEMIRTDMIALVTLNFNGWAIFSLSPIEDRMNKTEMKIGEEWTFISAINSGDITRNINSELLVGVSAYAKTSRNNTIYESGSFTANLLTVDCPSGEIVDDIDRVRKWMKFICGDNPFLLKSEKGDSWVVNIVNSPNRRYDETLNPIFTNVSYEWAESKDIRDIVIKN